MASPPETDLTNHVGVRDDFLVYYDAANKERRAAFGGPDTARSLGYGVVQLNGTDLEYGNADGYPAGLTGPTTGNAQDVGELGMRDTRLIYGDSAGDEREINGELDFIKNAPSGISASDDTNGIFVNWTENQAYGNHLLYDYEIYRDNLDDATVGNFSKVQTQQGVGWVDTGVNAGDTYEYYVKLILYTSWGQESAQTGTASATWSGYPSITSLSVTDDDEDLTADLSASVDNGGGVDETVIDWGDGSTDTYSGARTTATHTYGYSTTYTVTYKIYSDGVKRDEQADDVTPGSLGTG